MFLLYHITGLLRREYLGYWYKGTCPTVHNCQAFPGALQMHYASVLSPGQLLPVGKDGLVTKAFGFSCNQLFISAKQADRAVFFLLCCRFFRARTSRACRQQGPWPRSVHGAAAQIHILLAYFFLMCVVLPRSQGKHRHNGLPRFSCHLETQRHRSTVERAGPVQHYVSIFIAVFTGNLLSSGNCNTMAVSHSSWQGEAKLRAAALEREMRGTKIGEWEIKTSIWKGTINPWWGT